MGNLSHELKELKQIMVKIRYEYRFGFKKLKVGVRTNIKPPPPTLTQKKSERCKNTQELLHNF